MKKNFLFTTLLLLNTFLLHATGGYDNGSAVGKGKLELDLTWNPFDLAPRGQSYMVWNYGLEKHLSLHGYLSHEATGTDQVYYGLKYTFLETKKWSLATALGVRHRKDELHTYAPQILYTYNLHNNYDIGGSIVSVYDTTDEEHLGVTYDIAFRIPFHFSWLDNYIKSSKFALGAFRNASGKLYPTYSVDFKF